MFCSGKFAGSFEERSLVWVAGWEGKFSEEKFNVVYEIGLLHSN